MLNISFLVCTIVIGPVFCKWGTLKAYSDLDLDPTMLNIELIRAIFIYYNDFMPRSFLFDSRAKTRTQNTNIHMRAHTHTLHARHIPHKLNRHSNQTHTETLTSTIYCMSFAIEFKYRCELSNLLTNYVCVKADIYPMLNRIYTPNTLCRITAV